LRYRLDRWLRVGGRARAAVLFVCLCTLLIAGSYLAHAHAIAVDGVKGEPASSSATPQTAVSTGRRQRLPDGH
jgi:hypothetical protein